MLPNLGVPELLVVLAILLLLFGARRIPEFARSVGNGIKEFRESSKDDEAPEERREPVALTGKVEVAREQSIPKDR